ncbi:MAG: hypothetical protein ACE5L6_06680 [Candidatus Bathyarchaeia archaeon]
MVSYEEIAEYAFMAFVVIAIIAGLAVGYMHYSGQSVADINGYLTLILLILGLIVGLVSITAKEVTPFLIAAIALMVTRAGLDVWEPLDIIHGLLHDWATYILNYIVAFVAPAAVIIAIKAVFALARKK